MYLSECKKGTRVVLGNGWDAEILSKPSKHAERVFCKVYGFFTECGDVWAHDIVRVVNPETGYFESVELTEKQQKFADKVRKQEAQWL